MGTLDIDPPRMLLTREVCETLARAELNGIREIIATVTQLYPEARAEGIEVAGGVVAFAGVDSAFSKAFGIGALAPTVAGDIERITEFYTSRNSMPRVFVTPLADPALGRGLAAAGYAPVEYDNVLLVTDPDAQALRDERINVATDLQAWIRASVAGFAGRRNSAHDDSVARILASSPGAIILEARENGVIVATSGMSVRGECASLFAGSVLPEHRQRGLQIAMIRDRIARARDAGARFIHAAAAPAGISERNFHRCGFTTLYTRTRWDRPLMT